MPLFFDLPVSDINSQIPRLGGSPSPTGRQPPEPPRSAAPVDGIRIRCIVEVGLSLQCRPTILHRWFEAIQHIMQKRW